MKEDFKKAKKEIEKVILHAVGNTVAQNHDPYNMFNFPNFSGIDDVDIRITDLIAYLHEQRRILSTTKSLILKHKEYLDSIPAADGDDLLSDIDLTADDIVNFAKKTEE